MSGWLSTLGLIQILMSAIEATAKAQAAKNRGCFFGDFKLQREPIQIKRTEGAS